MTLLTIIAWIWLSYLWANRLWGPPLRHHLRREEGRKLPAPCAVWIQHAQWASNHTPSQAVYRQLRHHCLLVRPLHLSLHPGRLHLAPRRWCQSSSWRELGQRLRSHWHRRPSLGLQAKLVLLVLQRQIRWFSLHRQCCILVVLGLLHRPPCCQ